MHHYIKIWLRRITISLQNTTKSVIEMVDPHKSQFEYALYEISRIENSISQTTPRSDVFKQLSVLSISDFGILLLSIPNPMFPNLSSILPRMATDEVQRTWTGSSGLQLLTQTTDFVRSLSYNYTNITGKPLTDKTILDFGCGYGRIARLMYYFTNENNYYGVDPNEKSIEICLADGLNKNFLLSDFLPTELPIKNKSFDLILAFSVFTHLSKKAAITSLNTLAKYLNTDGMIAITIWPFEYWNLNQKEHNLNCIEELKSLHHSQGFAFLPDKRTTIIDGDFTYGDTTMTFEWIEKTFPTLKVVGNDRSLSDPYQIYVFIQKRIPHDSPTRSTLSDNHITVVTAP